MQSNQDIAITSNLDDTHLKDDITRAAADLEYRIINLYILNSITYLSTRLIKINPPLYILGLIFSLFVFVASIVVAIICREPIIPISYHLLFVSFLAGFALVIVRIGYRHSLSILFSVTDYFADVEAYIAITRWILRAFTPSIQILVSLCFAYLGCAMAAAWSTNKTAVPIHSSSYVATSLASFVLGDGAYLALLIPTIVRVASRYRFRLYSFAPSEAPFIRKAKLGFGVLTFAYAVIFSVILLELYQLHPSGSYITTQITIWCLLFGLTLISYSFLYPHYFLSRIIRREKWAVLDSLQAKIDQLYRENNPPDAKFASEIKALIELYSLIKDSSSNSLNFGVWRIYFSSLILPTISFLSGIVNWRGIISRFGL